MKIQLIGHISRKTRKLCRKNLARNKPTYLRIVVMTKYRHIEVVETSSDDGLRGQVHVQKTQGNVATKGPNE